MLPLEDAQSAIAQAIRPVEETETVSLDAVVGRYAAQALRACVDHPPFDNSAMDGYALRFDDAVAHDFRLPVVAEASAGAAPKTLPPGSAMRIFTGAPLPQGADTVVMQEDVERDGECVRLPRTLKRGANIRRRAEDYAAGDALYSPGRRLRTIDVGLLAAAGIEHVEVYRRPRVLLAPTGDELAPVGTPLKAGQIYESNGRSLSVLLQASGAQVTEAGIVRDDVQALRAVLQNAKAYDFVITSGGVSVGERDVVKEVYAAFGDIALWKVAIKPGKPIAFGHIGARTHFFALPGNPLSTLVTYKVFVEPALVRWQHGTPQTWYLRASAANGFRRKPGRTEFLRARLESVDGRLIARALAGQGSHQIGALRDTNAFIRVEAASAGFAANDEVFVLPLDFPGDAL